MVLKSGGIDWVEEEESTRYQKQKTEREMDSQKKETTYVSNKKKRKRP